MTNGELGKKVIFLIFDNSSCVHVDYREKDIVVLGEGPTDGLDDLRLHYNRKKILKPNSKIFKPKY